eukprot:m.55597 g.55597  ORF g.55597 m.55597 type:complete len:237 (+) comp34492_c0_seq8:206-916(+)
MDVQAGIVTHLSISPIRSNDGSPPEARHRTSVAQSLASEAGGIRERASCSTLALEGERLLSKKRYGEAIPYLEGALMLQPDDPELKSVVWCLLGNSHFQVGHFEAASRCHMHDMAVCRQAKDFVGEMKACCNFGVAAQMQGKLKMAGRSFLKYMDGCVKTSYRPGIAKAYNNLAILWRMQGKEVIQRATEAGTVDTVEVKEEARRNFRRAIEYLVKYLDFMRELKDRLGFCLKFCI